MTLAALEAPPNAADDPLGWLEAVRRPYAAKNAAKNAANPARWRVLQALARRAASVPPGALRKALAAKLQDHWVRLHQSEPTTAQPAQAASDRTTGPLTDLLTQLSQTAAPSPADQPSELRSLSLDPRGWTRLRLDHRLTQLHTPPAQALGPLNALALVPRAMAVLNACSPDYLQRLLAYIDALAALAPPSGAAAAREASDTPPASKRKRKG